jgi:acetyl esterase/lipase
MVLAFSVRTMGSQTEMLTTKDVLEFPVPPADRRILYGPHPLQFGDLRMPKGEGPFPVAIIVHGGCWLAEYNLDHIASFCADLTEFGVATWSLEYRRVGDKGGGWPGTFEDVAKGTDHLRNLAEGYALDLDRVVAVGHSAGGHLVLWLAARDQLPEDSPGYARNPLQLSGVVSLAGISDLEAGYEKKVCGDSVDRLLGGSPADVPSRYRQASPIRLLPLGVPQRLVHCGRDPIVPVEMSKDYEAAGRKKGDLVELTVCSDGGHFEPIAPKTPVGHLVRDAIIELTRRD